MYQQRPPNKVDSAIGEFFRSKLFLVIAIVITIVVIGSLIVSCISTMVFGGTVIAISSRLLTFVDELFQGPSAWSPEWTLEFSTPTQSEIIWATGTVEIDQAMRDAITMILLTDPPTDALTNIYAVTSADPDEAGRWGVSLVNLVLDPPYEEWGFEQNGSWAGSMFCSLIYEYWNCEYFAR